MEEIDEAIQHCLEVAEKHERHAKILKKRLLGSGLNTVDYCLQCAADHRQLAEWLKELKELRSLKTDYVFFKVEAKKLLKAAVEDFAHMDFHIYECDGMCDTCPLHGERDNCLVWQYADEAEKLLKEE